MPSDKGEILMLKHVLELPSALFIGLVSLYFSFGQMSR
jgi:hypothetical protein